jgi:hypothetical protein
MDLAHFLFEREVDVSTMLSFWVSLLVLSFERV